MLTLKNALMASLLFCLAACASEPRPDPIKLDYTDLPKINIDAADLRVINRAANTPHWQPYVGHEFEPTLTDAIYRVVEDRLQAAGRLGHATFIIKEASLTQQKLNMSDDYMDQLFKRQQDSQYIGRIEVVLETQSPTDGAIGMATAHAVHKVSLPENPTEYEKYESYRRLLSAIMKDLNRELESAIRQHMGRFILDGTQDSAPHVPQQPRKARMEQSGAPVSDAKTMQIYGQPVRKTQSYAPAPSASATPAPPTFPTSTTGSDNDDSED